MTPTPFQHGFSQEAPLAAGTVRGIRTWKSVIDDDGRIRLRGQHGHLWEPGENAAECETYYQVEVKVELSRSTETWVRIGAFIKERVAEEERQKAQQIGEARVTEVGGCGAQVGPDCTCGFYAFWEPPDQVSADVVGVVEGYGKTTIGRMGFRSQKARVVAIAPSVDQFGKPLTYMGSIAAEYPDVPVFDNTMAMLAEYSADEAPDIEDDEDDFETLARVGGGVPHPLTVATSFHMEPPAGRLPTALLWLAMWAVTSTAIYVIISLVTGDWT